MPFTFSLREVLLEEQCLSSFMQHVNQSTSNDSESLAVLLSTLPEMLLLH